MVGKAGLIVLLACTLCCAHMVPRNGPEDAEQAAREGVPSNPAPVWVLIDKLYRGTKWLRIRGKGFAGDIKLERIGETPVTLEWKTFYGRGAGRGHYRSQRGPHRKWWYRDRGKNGYRFWVRLRW